MKRTARRSFLTPAGKRLRAKGFFRRRGFGFTAPLAVAAGAFGPRAVGRSSFWSGPALASGSGAREKKTIDLDVANYEITSTGSVTLLNGVATGDDFTDRDGRRIMMKSVYITGYTRPTDNNYSDHGCRMLIVYDKQANGAAPAVTAILKENTFSGQLNLNNRSRFQIIADKRWVVGSRDTTATMAFAASPSNHNVKIFKSLNMDTQYSGTTAAVASIATGALYMVLIADNGAGLGSTFSGTTRVRFMDA